MYVCTMYMYMYCKPTETSTMLHYDLLLLDNKINTYTIAYTYNILPSLKKQQINKPHVLKYVHTLG